MSALPSEADIRASFRHVCLGPQADMFPNSEAAPVEAASQFKTAHIAVGSFELAAKGSARDIRELVPLSRVALTGLKNKVSVMTANRVTAFEAFKSFVEFYPKLGATIAFGTMAAAARMIPTSGAAISDAPQEKGPELVSLANISAQQSGPRKRRTAQQSSPRKRRTAQQSSPRKRRTAEQSSPRKRRTAHKTPRKTSKRATGRRRKAA
jgi:hypothetical protein